MRAALDGIERDFEAVVAGELARFADRLASSGRGPVVVPAPAEPGGR